jgi:hypothetical protein
MTTDRYPVPPPVLGWVYVPATVEPLSWAVIQRLQITGPTRIITQQMEWLLYYSMMPGVNGGPPQRPYMN